MKHTIELWLLATCTAIGVAAGWSGCGSSNDATSPAGGPDGAGGDAGVTCPPCVTDDDCAGGACAQLGGDTYCAPRCPNGNECTDGRTCIPASSATGDQVNVCVPSSDVCSAATPATDDGGSGPGPCGSLVPPTSSSSCTSCTGKSSCQANGCYGGWWCNTSTNKCQAPPTGCTQGGGAYDGGAPVTGTVGANGGSISRLYFAVVGDTRPASIDDTAGYPTKIIEKIYSDIEALPPRPAFVVSTGDYQFASTSGNQSAAQMDLYLGARGKYSGPSFPAMGNHECTGATASNCGPGNKDGTTNNYEAFLSKMLGPLQKSSPWFEVDVNATDGKWTAKLLFVAANAWSQEQASWLDGAMARATTYTFVVRHEPRFANQAPGVTPSEQIMASHPYTLSIVGHTHTYEHFSGREVIVGNGGAPLTGNKNYGFIALSQRADGAIVVDAIDYLSGQIDPSFHFAVQADGSATQ